MKTVGGFKTSRQQHKKTPNSKEDEAMGIQAVIAWAAIGALLFGILVWRFKVVSREEKDRTRMEKQ